MKTWTLTADITAGRMSVLAAERGAHYVGVTQGRLVEVSALGNKPPEWMVDIHRLLLDEGVYARIDRV